jgi:hypothetical protein
MRIKFGNSIRLCSNVTLSGKLLIITNSNGVYTVDVETEENAEYIHTTILERGYFDLCGYDYSMIIVIK